MTDPLYSQFSVQYRPMNQVFKDTEYLPALLFQMDVTGSGIYVHFSGQEGSGWLSVKRKLLVYLSDRRDRASSKAKSHSYEGHTTCMFLNTDIQSKPGG